MSNRDIVIVGAGSAGIAAGRRLVAAGQQVLVIEARNRVGGRAVTDRSLGYPADLGAAWLHFAEQNAWTDIAEQNGFTVLRREPGWGAGAGIGARLPDAAEQAAARANYERYNALIDSTAASGEDVALSTVLPQDSYRPRFDATMTWAVGVESRDVSTLDLARYADSDHNWPVVEGLGAVLASGAAGLPIRLGCKLTAVDWSGEGVRIDCSDGHIDARAVIITLPTSVLAGEVVRFTPSLPAEYTDAFHAVPLGIVNKVFFPLDATQFAEHGTRHFIATDQTSRTCSFIVHPADQPLLCAFFGGDLSRELEQQHGLESFARDALRRSFGADLERGIGAGISTAWGSDPFARGSYSAALPGKARCRQILARPVAPQLLFAGEACSAEYYGTVHGAWLSGVAAAEQLLKGNLLR